MQKNQRLVDTELFGIAELSAAVLDGEIVKLNESYHSVCEIQDAALRADSLRLADRLIAERRTAAWIYGALPTPPTLLEVCMNIKFRTRPPTGRFVNVREVVISDRELLRIGRTLVTSPKRTILDLLRLAPSHEDQIDKTILGVVRTCKVDPIECADFLKANWKANNYEQVVGRFLRLTTESI
ncbi:MAG: hypothetical protein IT191_02800 [Microbacteriaceae bacterium]|nr:hypothetical protein [Cryobacterium sp.]MBX3104391.1 hypothetical protein [Cryobacterium sp.]MCC6375925.1 hypothetical protein [Microbacteriaceae bacterium]